MTGRKPAKCSPWRSNGHGARYRAHAQILLMQRSVASSTENLRQNRNFYDAGTATLTDLLDAETLYTQSRNNLTSAYAAYHTSLAKYMRVTGR